MANHTAPSGVERFFDEGEIIVSKTTTNGIITYTNDVFVRVSGYREEELIGAPHSLIRHPDMPRSVFRLLWDVIEKRDEIFAYVVNMARNGDHYWVLAHVTPSYAADGRVVGYHSNRRVPSRSAIDAIRPVYAALLAEEQKHERKADGIAAATEVLTSTLRSIGKSYEEFVWGLTNADQGGGRSC
ncbi:MAG: PAS domain-containing protein [Myxococcales bacterium]|nr:PAS domain-containing protein [Myxococcales bacterium]